MIEYKKFDISYIEQVEKIYQKQGWVAYLQDGDKLKRSFQNSLYLLGAFDKEVLVGFARCVGDGEHILMVQDLIVDKDYQKQEIGTNLFKKILSKYEEVRTFIVITDLEDEVDNKFYQSFGLKSLKSVNMIGYIR